MDQIIDIKINTPYSIQEVTNAKASGGGSFGNSFKIGGPVKADHSTGGSFGGEAV